MTFLPLGFEPSAITRPKGSFLLIVENRSGLDALDFTLYRRVGNNRQEVSKPTKKKKLDWSDAFDLSPGEYELRETGYPNRFCAITITAK